MAYSTTTLQNLYGSLSLNTSATNLALGLQLMNIEQKYLLEKYFSNEASFSVTTVGSQSLTSTVAPTTGAVSATLSAVWAYPSSSPYVTFSDGEIRIVNFTFNSTAITWSGGLTGTTFTTALSVGGVQAYRLPADYSKLKTGTLTIGSLKWTPTEILSREEWDRLNVFPYYADIPSKFFIWNNQFNFWPIPSTTGNIITFNYKRRIPDLSLIDATGTASVSNGAVAVTGASGLIPTTNIGNESRWIQFAQPSGDNLWYQVQSVDSATALTLYAPYQGITVASGAFTLGQMPILMEDFHDMLVWRALIYYFTSINPNEGKAKNYQTLYDQKLELMGEYAGSKTVQVNLSRKPYGHNPNLFPYNNLG